MARAEISVSVLPSTASSASTAPAAGPSWKPWPENPKAWKSPAWRRLGPTTGLPSAVSPSTPVQMRMTAACLRCGTILTAVAAARRATSGAGREVSQSSGDLAFPAAKEHIAARDLAQIEIAADDAQHGTDAMGQRLGHQDLGDLGLERDGLAEPAGHFPRPSTGAVEQPGAGELPTVGCRQAEFTGAHLASGNLRPLLDLDPGAACRFGEGGGDEPRIGLAILGGEGAADNQLPQPGKARPQRIAAEGLEIETEAGGVSAMLLDHRHVGFAAPQAEVAGDAEFAVGADELG